MISKFKNWRTYKDKLNWMMKTMNMKYQGQSGSLTTRAIWAMELGTHLVTKTLNTWKDLMKVNFSTWIMMEQANLRIQWTTKKSLKLQLIKWPIIRWRQDKNKKPIWSLITTKLEYNGSTKYSRPRITPTILRQDRLILHQVQLLAIITYNQTSHPSFLKETRALTWNLWCPQTSWVSIQISVSHIIGPLIYFIDKIGALTPMPHFTDNIGFQSSGAGFNNLDALG